MDKMLLRLARAAPVDSSARSYLCQLARSISLADRPVEDAERVLRRALVAPNEQKSDLDAIAACSRLKAWLRKDHIDRRYRGSDRYMRAATALREADPRVPPSLEALPPELLSRCEVARKKAQLVDNQAIFELADFLADGGFVGSRLPGSAPTAAAAAAVHAV